MNIFYKFSIISIILMLAASCQPEQKTVELKSDLQCTSGEFVRLALQLGHHDPHYVDAYFGPEIFKTQSEVDTLSLDVIIARADSLVNVLDGYNPQHFDTLRRMRWEFLRSQIASLAARARFASGIRMTFDEESRSLYGVTVDSYPEQFYKDIIQGLDTLLPGRGGIVERYIDFKKQFVIPPDDLARSIDVTLRHCKNATYKHLELPAGESFGVEYIEGEPWPAYNWFKGNAHSVIQINRDFEFHPDMVITIAAHEAYPGHHVYHSLTEHLLYQDSGWTEFSILPLFSPFALVSEGSANYAVSMAFPGDSRVDFAKKVIFPIAGLDTSLAGLYFKIQDMKENLDYAGIDAARMYLDGDITRDQTAVWLMKYQLRSREQAEKHLDFIERYRSYVVNYVAGERLVKSYVKRHGGDTSEVRRWDVFRHILTTPMTPERLRNE